MKSLKLFVYTILLVTVLLLATGCNEASGRVGNYRRPQSTQIEMESDWQTYHDFRAEAYR